MCIQNWGKRCSRKAALDPNPLWLPMGSVISSNAMLPSQLCRRGSHRNQHKLAKPAPGTPLCSLGFLGGFRTVASLL